MKPLLEQGALGLDTNLEMYWNFATTIKFENHLIWFTRTFWVSYPTCCRGHATMPVGPCRQSRNEPPRGKRMQWLWVVGTGCGWESPWISHPTFFLTSISEIRFYHVVMVKKSGTKPDVPKNWLTFEVGNCRAAFVLYPKISQTELWADMDEM